VFARPIARRADPAQLAGDLAAILGLPFPGAPQEFFTPNLLTAGALATQQLLDLRLSGDSSVIGAGKPQHRFAKHAVPARNHIFDRHKHRVAHMQLAGDIWRRHRHGKRFTVWIDMCRKEARTLPPIVQALLDLLRLIGFGHLGRT